MFHSQCLNGLLIVVSFCVMLFRFRVVVLLGLLLTSCV